MYTSLKIFPDDVMFFSGGCSLMMSFWVECRWGGGGFWKWVMGIVRFWWEGDGDRSVLMADLVGWNEVGG